MYAFRRLLPLLYRYRWHMLVVIVSSGGITAMNLVNPWLVRELVQILRVETGDAATNRILQLATVLFVVFIFRAIFRFMYLYIAHVMAYSFVNDLRVAVYDHLQKLSARFFADRQTGELIKRVINDTRDIEPLIAHYIPDMTVNVLLLIGVGIILFNLNPMLALLTLLPMPLLVVSNLFLGKRMHSAIKDSSRRLGILTGIVQDNLVGIKEIQLFTQEKREHERINEYSTDTTKTLLYGLKMQAILSPSIEFLTAMGLVIVVLFGGQAALGGTLPVEDLVAFFLYLNIFYQPITLMTQMNEMLHVAITGAHHVVEVMDIRPDVDDAPNAVNPGRLRGEVEFHDVSFLYNEHVATLKNISFKIQPGQTLALVGPTGAGKTTIASLVPRFYDTASGTVTIDGIDVQKMTVSGLRSNISMVLQDVFLFNGTIRDNIRYSNLNSTDEEIIAAAKAARAHDFIMAMPEGYDTHIGERGVKVSGGQKQRLAIARAVLKNAPILILDEATSAVDTETEAEIQEALNELMKGRTSIVIAHRLSTIKNAHQILVLDGGRIVEKGRHQELIYGRGRYQRLHEASARLN
ncbi:MAG: ABC transporter ATP-binding protein/permease [Chloroflexi bacterium]|nr:ABC transporter ATP-binding protein/permease [Chloroflexota bacterium]MCC6892476.1 ABC transporter ATP-binding protein [Anaerolineae bacterium]